MGCREALKADPIQFYQGRLQGSHDKYSDTILNLGIYIYIYICINRRISQRHFILFTVQKLTVFHKDFNN